MKNRQKNLIYWAVAILVVGGIIGALVYQANQPGAFDNLAKCMEKKGVKFFGAYWCPACNNQKRIFGNSEKYLPYIECSDPGQRNQNETCSTAGIEQYPTWEFPGGERSVGIMTPEELSEKTDCPIVL